MLDKTTVTRRDKGSGEHVDSVKSLVQYPGWNRIVGRLATICGMNSEFLDRDNLIGACWGVSVFGYPYRNLLRAVRKSVQFCLHELSPQVLGQLAISIAAEEISTYGAFRLSDIGAKLNRDFVDQVALSALRNIENISPLEIQIDTIIAIAQLGGGGGMSGADDGIAASSDESHRKLQIDETTIKALDTSTLVKFHWACGRLPSYIASKEAIQMMRNEIKSRLNDDTNIMSETMLYLRSLGDAYVSTKNAEVAEGAHESCEELTRQWSKKAIEILGGKEESVGDVTNILEAHWFGHDDKGYSSMSRTAGALIESLQSFFVLEYFSSDFLDMCSDFLYRYKRGIELEERDKSKTKTRCNEEFHIGRLEELLSVYQAHVHDKGGNRGFEKVKRRFSKFLHGVLHRKN